MRDIFNESDEEPSSKRLKADIKFSESGSAEDERKRLERERNRIHARNTRARKKAYADELTAKLEALTKEKEEIERLEVEAGEARTKQQQAWIETLKKVMDLRAQFCLDPVSWEVLLAEDFKLTMPVTPYRSFNIADIVNNRRVLLGVDGMIADTASLQVMCDNIGVKTIKNEGRVSIKYLLGSNIADNCFFGDYGIMCTFLMCTIDAKVNGAHCECEKSGMLRARFNVNNQLEELEMSFDGIAMYHQLMRARGESTFPVIPNTLAAVLKNEKDRIVVTTAQRPFRITHVNSAWTDLCGFELDECKGKNLSILQGPETDMDTVTKLVNLTQQGYPASMVVTNYSKNGRTFRNHLRCYPLSSDDSGEITNIVGYLEEIAVE
jgi:PAS domain S-box-containing protein